MSAPLARIEVTPRDLSPYRVGNTGIDRHDSFAFARPVIGFGTFAEGELVATDGELGIRAPCDDCTVFMPARQAIVGREGVYLTRPMN